MDGLRFVIYDKTGAFQRDLSGLTSDADFLPNQIPTAEFTLDDDHEALPFITADGARCAVHFRGEERFRGRITTVSGEGPIGSVTAHVDGDIRKLWDWYGWQVPGAPLDAQASEYRVYTGKPEAVFKAALAENFARLGVPWTVAPVRNIGTRTVRVEFRMHPLADKLIPVLDADGLVVVIAYDDEGPGVTVDVREPNTVPGILTLDSGIPDSYSFSTEDPAATRVIVGGRGEGVEREFVQVIDAELEAHWGDIIEGFKDGRNTEEGSDLTIDARQALDEAAARVSFSTTLVETKRLEYGTTYVEGDLVHVQVGPVDVKKRISVSVTESAASGESGGVVVKPTVGELNTSTNIDAQIAQQLEALARGARDQGRR